MTPTPEQVEKWALEEATAMGSMSMFATLQEWRDHLRYRLVTRAMAEQAEADAKLCESGVDTAHPTVPNIIMPKFGASSHLAAAIRANAPKVTT